MNCQQIISLNLSMLLGILFFPQPKVFAQSTVAACQAPLYIFSVIQGKDKIPELTQAEIINDSDFVEQVNTQEELLAGKVPYKANATRDIQTYWQMRITKSDFDSLAGKNAKYKLVNPDNQLGNPFKDNVKIQPLNSIEKIDCLDNKTVVVGGGIKLDFSQLAQLVSGNFKAQIQVCLPTNNNLCP
jgi:hypothetical protein